MITVIPFPAIDPILIDFGTVFGVPIAIRWYALLWIGGCLLAWRYVRWFVRAEPKAMKPEDADDFLFWGIIGTVLGGRIGYLIFYAPDMVAAHPSFIFRIWEGGLSFHGGLAGVVVAVILFTRKRGLPFWSVSDAICCSAPIGLACVRIANFINGELFGRVTDVPWAMVFPRGGPEPRHPSQLYEMALEGIVLFVVLHLLSRNEAIRTKPGLLTGVFFAGYAIARGTVELVRQPDPQLGFLVGGATMGQLLSIPVLLFGLFMIWRARRRS